MLAHHDGLLEACLNRLVDVLSARRSRTRCLPMLRATRGRSSEGPRARGRRRRSLPRNRRSRAGMGPTRLRGVVKAENRRGVTAGCRLVDPADDLNILLRHPAQYPASCSCGEVNGSVVMRLWTLPPEEGRGRRGLDCGPSTRRASSPCRRGSRTGSLPLSARARPPVRSSCRAHFGE
jgi:hypothetical protein